MVQWYSCAYLCSLHCLPCVPTYISLHPEQRQARYTTYNTTCEHDQPASNSIAITCTMAKCTTGLSIDKPILYNVSLSKLNQTQYSVLKLTPNDTRLYGTTCGQLMYYCYHYWNCDTRPVKQLVCTISWDFFCIMDPENVSRYL